ncbi:MAG TPA: hypothetical protein VLA74_11390, partial [Nitrososphaeraceae archaeon]|nr:hypothetical protein [Nitrososphaeraceae archaeon]
IVAPPSIHPDNNNKYTLLNGINPVALTKKQISKLIDLFKNNNNNNDYNSEFHYKSQNIEKDLKEIDEKTVYEIISRVKPYYKEGIRNDFILYFSGWLRKLDVRYDNAEKLINELAIDDEERNTRIKTLKETYKKQDPEEIAGYSYLLELLSEQDNSSIQTAIAKLKEIPKILEEKQIIKKGIKGHKKENNEAKKEKKEIVTFKYSQMGRGDLHEAILSAGSLPFFTKYNHEKKEFELVENIEENSRILRPPEREEYPYTPYEFSGLEEIKHYKDFIINNNIDIDYLFQTCKSIISKFNNQDNYKVTLIAADGILSYSQDRFSTIHYDFIVGGNGSGKSSLGDTVGAIAYRAVIMTDPTAPNLFRLLGSAEPAQCTIVLEEADRIDKSPELMAILKTGYARNGRVPKINPNTLKQEFFFSYCQKVIISERSLSQSIAKGVNTRILPINCFKGQTKYDIKEILNPTDTGGSQNKELLKELEDFRKLLLVYRLMHFKDPIPDLDIGVEGRDKELVKHLIQLFYGSKCLQEIIESLQKFLDIKNQKKETSLDHVLLPIISDLIKDNGPQMLFRTFWNVLKESIPGKEDEKKPNEYHTEDYGTLYSTTITNLLSDIFGATTKHGRKGNMLIFDPKIIEKLSKKDKTKIIVTELSNQLQSSDDDEEKEENNEVDQEAYSHINDCCEGVKGVSTPRRGIAQIIDAEKDSIEIQNSLVRSKDSNISNTNNNSNDYQNHQNQIIDSLVLVNGNHKKEKSNSTPFSYAFTPFTPSHANKSITLIDGEVGLFTNPLISKSDLATGNYDPEIINNIDRVHPNSDRWFCHNCTLRDDKWGMMKHPCSKNDINNKGGSKLI